MNWGKDSYCKEINSGLFEKFSLQSNTEKKYKISSV